MNEQTQEALVKLAEKLGTTTEYLWQILIAQARVDIVISVIQMTFMFLFIYWTIKLHIRFSKKHEDRHSFYYYNESAVGGMVFAGLASIIMIIFFLNGFNDLLSAIFNPEYWALKQIFESI